MNLIEQVDKTWTLFLDRDGVLNHEKNQDYIRNKSEFEFYPEVLNAFSKLHKIFGLILIVTNQRGIGKGLMSHDDLNEIHQHMKDEISAHGGRIDAIYYAPELDNSCINRKPNPGMGLQAKKDFPQIDFSKSIMVGNNISDMQFGKNLGMKTVYVETTKPLPHGDEHIDIKLLNFPSFADLF